MKIIGKFPRNKGWVVHYNDKTGAVYGGYEPPIGLSEERTLYAVEEALKWLQERDGKPPIAPVIAPPPYSKNSTEEERRIWGEWRDYRFLKDTFDRCNEAQYWRTFNYLPVFREVATFIGYHRGRSSVTMRFQFANGGELEIGPQGIDKFITGIQSGAIGRKNGGFDLTFKMVKQGSNVSMMPLYEVDDFKGMEWLKDDDGEI